MLWRVACTPRSSRIIQVSEEGWRESYSVSMAFLLDDPTLLDHTGTDDEGKLAIDLSSGPNESGQCGCCIVCLSPPTHISPIPSDPLRRVEGMDGYRDCTKLNLSGNRITSLEGLSPLTSLTHLNLARNVLRNVDAIARFPLLKFLDISGNVIPYLPTSFTALQVPTYLPVLASWHLHVNGCVGIGSAKCLGQLSRIHELYPTSPLTGIPPYTHHPLEPAVQGLLL